MVEELKIPEAVLLSAVMSSIAASEKKDTKVFSVTNFCAHDENVKSEAIIVKRIRRFIANCLSPLVSPNKPVA